MPPKKTINDTVNDNKSRKPVKKCNDEESTSVQNGNSDEYENYRYRIHSVADHLEDRFTRYIRFLGLLQKISEEVELSRGQIVIIGKSQCQDQSSNRGIEIHAAHVIRLQTKSMEKKYEAQQTELENLLGHTQNVQKWANFWHGVGGGIDRFQSDYLKILNTVNFKEGLTSESEGILNNAKNEYIAILKTHYDGTLGTRLDAGQKSQLEKAIIEITSFSIDVVYAIGNEGYIGNNRKDYQ